MTTTAITTSPGDRTRTEQAPHLVGNLAPVADETTSYDLPVTGELPAALSGSYLRNGPNPRNGSEHWFTGDGMVHGVRIENGTAVAYRNRYVRTDSFEHPFPLYDRTGQRHLHASKANTHVVRHAGHLFALVESSLPYEITTELETLGCYDFDGALDDSMTAHPKICPATGELHFFGYGNLREPYVTYHRADASGRITHQRPVDVPGLTMMHDFCLTEHHVVFLDLPVVFRMDLAVAGAGMPYRWSDDYGARMGVLSRDEPDAPIRWFDIDPCYVFHTASAYEVHTDDADRIVVSGMRYDELWRDGAGFGVPSSLHEWTLDLRSGTASERRLDDVDAEFPRIDDRRTGLSSRFVYAVGDHAILRYDTATGSRKAHDFGADEPGEMAFVPAGPDAAEGDGWLLGYVFRPATSTSDLVVLDAADVGAEPVATVHLPVRVPAGFHGDWFAD